MNRIAALVCLSFAASGRADESLVDRIRKFDLKAVVAQDPTAAWSQDVRARRDAVNLADRKAWAAVGSKEEWEKFKAPRLGALRDSLGELPPPPEKLAIHKTRTIRGDGFKIDNLIYETRPGFFVTANLYGPDKTWAKMPGILIVTSHHNPKTQGELQDMGMTWARLGCLVLVPDQIGHGERRNHPFTDAGKYPGPFKVGRQDYYFRYYEALQLHLIGDSLMGWMVNDYMRGVDVLLSQPGIDKGAIVLLGSVAGGGDPAAVTAALDPRIAAVVPYNFGGPQPETRFPLPEEAEARFNYMGGGSWESTRGLRLSGQGGFLPWVIVGAAAPRGLIYGHEFAWDAAKDPVWARLRKIYGFYNAPDMLSSTHGRGAVTGKPPEATHCNNIGPMHRKQMYPTLKKWFGIAEPDMDYQKRLPSEDLQCWTEEARKTYHARQLWETAADVGEQRSKRVRAADADAANRGLGAMGLRRRWTRLLGSTSSSPEAHFEVKRIAKPLTVEAGVRQGGIVSYCLIPPENGKRGEKYALVVTFCQGGIQATATERARAVAALLESGIAVCLAEFRGMRTKGDRGRSSASTSLSATEQMLGLTVLGQQLRELRELLAHLRKHEAVDGKRIALWGDSLAKINPPDRLLDVPLDADKMPDLAEPGSALLALLGGLFEEDVCAIYGRGGLVSYRSVLRSPFVYVPHDAVVPGAPTAGDWTDIAAALAPRSVRLEALVDGRNRRVTHEEIEKAYAPARAAFQKTADRLSLDSEPCSPEILARWFAAVLNISPQKD
jgi:hypothetical protein